MIPINTRSGALVAFAGALLCMFGVAAVAQSEPASLSDAERKQIERIRGQMGYYDDATNEREKRERGELRAAMEAVSQQLQKLQTEVIDLQSRVRALESRPVAVKRSPIPSRSAAANKIVPDSGAKQAPPAKGDPALITVCFTPECDYASLQQAVKAAAPGATIRVAPGVYKDCALLKLPVTLIGEKNTDGERAHLKGTACRGKGALIIAAPDVTIRGFKISNIKVRDKNGACFRIEKKGVNARIQDVVCLNSENGILGAPASGALTIEDSYFFGNGAGGKAHGMYLNSAADVVIRNTHILASENGHLLKTGAKSTLVENSVIAALGGNNGRAVDAYAGGKVVIRDSVIQLGPKTQNHDIFSFASESRRLLQKAEHSMLVENSWILFDDKNRCCRWLLGSRTSAIGPIIFRSNKIVGGIVPHFDAVTLEGNQDFASRKQAGLPNYDGTVESLPKPGS